MHIDDATQADVPAILAIYNDVLLRTTAIYTEEPVTLGDRLTWFQAATEAGRPVLVAREADGTVIGFASYGPFRAWPCYRTTVEHSVHVADQMRGRGVGGALVQALMARAASDGLHTVIGGIDAANEGSLRFHERLGFRPVARLQEVAWKFDRWLDLVFVQAFLDGRSSVEKNEGQREGN